MHKPHLCRKKTTFRCHHVFSLLTDVFTYLRVSFGRSGTVTSEKKQGSFKFDHNTQVHITK